MLKNKQFVTMKEVPVAAVSGMHPDTKMVIQKIKATKGSVLAVDLKSPREAKVRLDALRRARKRQHVQYKAAYRKGGKLYFQLR